MELYKLTNITANPYIESEETLYDQQMETRIQELNFLFTNHTAIQLNHNNSSRFDIISPSIKYKNGIRVTWFDNEIVLGHKDININSLEELTDDYLYAEIFITELIN